VCDAKMAGLLPYECDNRVAWGGEAALTRVVVQVSLGSRKRGSSAADLEFAILIFRGFDNEWEMSVGVMLSSC
jgi:hypothetical protein